jgi:uncharacterized protein (DUF3820 family)
MRKDHVNRQKIKLPFGKYKGFYLKDVPSDYLDWAAKHWVEEQYRPLLTIVVEEIAHRHFDNKKKQRLRKD